MFHNLPTRIITFTNWGIHLKELGSVIAKRDKRRRKSSREVFERLKSQMNINILFLIFFFPSINSSLWLNLCARDNNNNKMRYHESFIWQWRNAFNDKIICSKAKEARFTLGAHLWLNQVLLMLLHNHLPPFLSFFFSIFVEMQNNSWNFSSAR